MKSFPKLPISITEQIKRLTDRGLIISDRQSVEHYLTFIGYYHFSAYALYFQTDQPAPDVVLPDKPFREGTSFEQILDLYVFDRELRLLVMDAIERIEIAFRACIINEMCLQYGSHWFMDAKVFTPWFRHAQFILDLEREFDIQRDPRASRLLASLTVRNSSIIIFQLTTIRIFRLRGWLEKRSRLASGRLFIPILEKPRCAKK